MQMISSVFEKALAVQRRICVTEYDESRGISDKHHVNRGSKNEIKDLIDDPQATGRSEFIVPAGYIEERCTQDI